MYGDLSCVGPFKRTRPINTWANGIVAPTALSFDHLRARVYSPLLCFLFMFSLTFCLCDTYVIDLEGNT
ncbi:hypothetical protein BDV25DRAFT_162680 [Aspergillus avenaceus]|uniref:Uncharacterized protein n=1 Tax=Aspergillus avenaceus TaxID=36643 RepID=A0A5N6TJ51_ASPAV|nr:hypothetical protein BDV25DRAFT_162680 [Aspergillus avenaceus]